MKEIKQLQSTNLIERQLSIQRSYENDVFITRHNLDVQEN